MSKGAYQHLDCSKLLGLESFRVSPFRLGLYVFSITDNQDDHEDREDSKCSPVMATQLVSAGNGRTREFDNRVNVAYSHGPNTGAEKVRLLLPSCPKEKMVQWLFSAKPLRLRHVAKTRTPHLEDVVPRTYVKGITLVVASRPSGSQPHEKSSQTKAAGES